MTGHIQYSRAHKDSPATPGSEASSTTSAGSMAREPVRNRFTRSPKWKSRAMSSRLRSCAHQCKSSHVHTTHTCPRKDVTHTERRVRLEVAVNGTASVVTHTPTRAQSTGSPTPGGCKDACHPTHLLCGGVCPALSDENVEVIVGTHVRRVVHKGNSGHVDRVLLNCRMQKTMSPSWDTRGVYASFVPLVRALACTANGRPPHRAWRLAPET